MAYQSRWYSSLLIYFYLHVILDSVTGFNSTSVMFLSSPLLISSSEFSSTLPPTSTPVPPRNEGNIKVVKPGCFFLEASDISFTVFDHRFENVSLQQLRSKYRNYTDSVTGCDPATKVHNFTSFYYDDNKKLTFSFTLQFVHNNGEKVWYLDVAKSVNLTVNNSHIFDYNCRRLIDVPDDLSFYCSQIECHGNERLNNRISATLRMTDIKIDAFLSADSSLPSNDELSCGKSDPNNQIAFLIVALVIAATLTVAVVIIICSFVYKRYKYGRYNLLD